MPKRIIDYRLITSGTTSVAIMILSRRHNVESTRTSTQSPSSDNIDLHGRDEIMLDMSESDTIQDSDEEEASVPLTTSMSTFDGDTADDTADDIADDIANDTADDTTRLNSGSSASNLGEIQGSSISSFEIDSEVQLLTGQHDNLRSNTNIVTIILVLILLRSIVEGLVTGDSWLLFVNIIFTSYFLRWKMSRESQLDRMRERIENLSRIQYHGNYDSGDEEMAMGTSNSRQDQQRRRRRLRQLQMQLNSDHVDIGMLSFHAQLAFAMMESQRLIHGSGDEIEEQPMGVSDEKKKEWLPFDYCDESSFYNRTKFSVKDNEDPTCCICLCEYERGEKLVQLPCDHVYHSDCIDSWCQSHVRCPLCNVDLDQRCDIVR